MATPIEQQIHRHAQALADAKAKAKGKKSNPVPKPWTRPHPQALCQDLEFLEVVREFDYCLDNDSFQAFCRTRGVLHIAGVKGGRLWQYMAEHGRTREEYLRESEFRVAQEWHGTRRPYSEAELESGWAILQLGRAKLQDCWELFKALENQDSALRPR